MEKKRVREIHHEWTKEEIGRLIAIVKRNNAVWNCISEGFRNPATRESSWDEISKEMKLPRAEVTAKWSSVRSSFRAAFDRLDKNKKYREFKHPMYNALEFLVPVFRLAPTLFPNMEYDDLSDEITNGNDISFTPPYSPPAKVAKIEHSDEDALCPIEVNSSSEEETSSEEESDEESAPETSQLSEGYKAAMRELISNFEKEIQEMNKNGE